MFGMAGTCWIELSKIMQLAELSHLHGTVGCCFRALRLHTWKEVVIHFYLVFKVPRQISSQFSCISKTFYLVLLLAIPFFKPSLYFGGYTRNMYIILPSLQLQFNQYNYILVWSVLACMASLSSLRNFNHVDSKFFFCPFVWRGHLHSTVMQSTVIVVNHLHSQISAVAAHWQVCVAVICHYNDIWSTNYHQISNYLTVYCIPAELYVTPFPKVGKGSSYCEIRISN